MAAQTINRGLIMKALDWSYEKAVDGVAGLDTAQELAESYNLKSGGRDSRVCSLIRWQVAKAGTSGFITGLGGVITMPVSIPANLASVLYVQIRMVAAIAHIGGHNIYDDRVKTLAFACMAGNGAKDILKQAGIQVGKKLGTNAIKSISVKTIVAINQKVGFRLLTKFGEKGVVNLGKAVPLLGGVIGGSFDAAATKIIGTIARKTFIYECA